MIQKIPQKIQLQLFISILFLTGSIITYINKTNKSLDIVTPVLDSILMLRSKTRLTEGMYLLTRKHEQNEVKSCLISDVKISIIKIGGQKYYKIIEKRDLGKITLGLLSNGRNKTFLIPFDKAKDKKYCPNNFIVYTK